MSTKKYLVMDLEVSAEDSYKKFCNALDLDNTITIIAWKLGGGQAVCECNPNDYMGGIPRHRAFDSIDLNEVGCIVGHNLKFDLLYLWSNQDLQEYLKKGGMLWDTQTAEYLLNGQDTSKRDLDTLSIKYGGTVKDDRVKVMFNSGLKANQIPADILTEYAKHDVLNTEMIFKAQIKQLQQFGMMPLFKVYMKHYAAVIEMEYNGLAVDATKLMEKAEQLAEELEGLKSAFLKYLEGIWPEQVEFNIHSNAHLSALLYGGELPYIADLPSLDEDGKEQYYKGGARAGELKTKKTKQLAHTWGMNLQYDSVWKTETGVISTTEKYLVEAKKLNTDTQIIDDLLEYRAKYKLLTTYYFQDNGKKQTGFYPLIQPSGCIHTTFKTAATKTGRLASSEPNLQNVPPEMLDVFVSRFANGELIELDFHQLEVNIQAYLAQDDHFIKDVKSGIDFHCKRLSYAERLPYEEVVANCAASEEWKLKRKAAKAVSFQKAYGAAPESIAKTTGLPVDVVKSIFEQEDFEYPGVKLFYEGVLDSIKETRYVTHELIQIKDKATGTYFTKPGEQKAYGIYQSVTGKRYTFEEKAILTKRNEVFRYWPMPDISNYPVQGTAADLVSLAVGQVYDFAKHHTDKFLMINEVHDSLLIDCKKEYLDFAISNISKILNNTPQYFKEFLGINLNVPIEIDVKHGETWKNCK